MQDTRHDHGQQSENMEHDGNFRTFRSGTGAVVVHFQYKRRPNQRFDGGFGIRIGKSKRFQTESLRTFIDNALGNERAWYFTPFRLGRARIGRQKLSFHATGKLAE